MRSFPTDAPKAKVPKALGTLGFAIVREHEHITMVRENADGTKTPLALPNHRTIKGSTMRSICTQVGIAREEFLEAYEKS